MKIILDQGPTVTLEELKEQAESNARLVYSSSVVLQLIQEIEQLQAENDQLRASLRRLLSETRTPVTMETHSQLEAKELVSVTDLEEL